MFVLTGKAKKDQNGDFLSQSYRLYDGKICYTYSHSDEATRVYFLHDNLVYDNRDDGFADFMKLVDNANKEGLVNLSDLELKPKRAPRKKAEPKVALPVENKE